MRETIIFVGGTGRCGTTAMREALAMHPNIHAEDPEPRWIISPGGALDLARAFNDRWDPWVGDEAVFRFRELCDSVGSAVSGRAKEWVHKHLVLGETTASRSDSKRPVMIETAPPTKNFFHELVSFAVDAGPEMYFVDDTPYSVCSANEIMRVSPKSIVIHMVRHPLDVLASMRSKRWAPDDWELCAHRIANVLQKAKFADATFRLEDVTVNPEKHLSGLFDFLKLDYDPACGAVFSLKKANIGRGKGLPKEAKAAYDKILKRDAKRLGYE